MGLGGTAFLGDGPRDTAFLGDLILRTLGTLGSGHLTFPTPRDRECLLQHADDLSDDFFPALGFMMAVMG